LGPAVARRSVGLVIVAEMADKKLINLNLNTLSSFKLLYYLIFHNFLLLNSFKKYILLITKGK